MWDFKPSGRIICMGSIIMDISVKCKNFPCVGETGYTPYSYEINPGGKGANQAVAAARSGADIAMIGHIAEDIYGLQLKENLNNAGVDTSLLISEKEEKSGVAFVWVNEKGDNQIICSPGVNQKMTVDDVERYLEDMEKGDIFLTTMEYPEELILAAVKKAKEKGGFVIVDPSAASVQALNPKVAQHIDIIKPNEVEAKMLSSIKVENLEDAKQVLGYLKETGITYPLVSLGDDGVLFYEEGQIIHEPAQKVNVVDTTAAGDTFIGAMASRLAKGTTLKEAVAYGNKAAALCVQRSGAQVSIPFEKEIK